MDPPVWGVFDQYTEFSRAEHAYYELSGLIPFCDAIKHFDAINNLKTTTTSKCAQLYGQSNNFEKVEEILQTLKIEKKVLLMELKIAIAHIDQATHLFDIFTKLWGGYLKMMPDMRILPSLKVLAARKLLERNTKVNVKKLQIPTNLIWLLEGLQMREKYDESWDERLDCRRQNAFRDFAIKAEVAGTLAKGSIDEAGKSTFKESFLPFYDSAEQRSWRNSNATFRPSLNNSSFSYEVKVPQNHATSSSVLAKKIDEALNIAKLGEISIGERWGFAAGSSGGTFTEHTYNRFEISGSHKFNRQNTLEARAGFNKFVQVVQTKPWENDKIVVTLLVRGGSCAELDLCASELAREISSNFLLDKVDVQTKCWFSSFFTDKNSPKIAAVKECLSQLTEAHLVTDVVLQIAKSDEAEREKWAQKLSKIPVPEGNANFNAFVQPAKKKNILQKIFSIDKISPKKETSDSPQSLWENSVEGKFYGSIVLRKFATNGEKDTELILGCASCVSMLSHRDSDFGLGIMSAMCPIHRMHYFKKHTEGSLGFNLGPKSLQDIVGIYFGRRNSLPNDTIGPGFVSPEILASCLGGLECGKILSRIWSWSEKNINQLLAR